MLSSISEFQKKIWNKWNIRIVILFSLFLQIFLIVSAPFRKRTRRVSVLSFVWLAYLLADWAAGYCIGLISNNQEQKSNFSDNDYLMAFWGPFLLLHLGGPDTISAFALEDNELWLRHLLGLGFQSVMTGYVFLLTVPRNKSLWLPTILMFVAGLIKYAERTHALYLAAVNNFRKSLLPAPDAGPNYAKLMEEHSSRQEAGLPAKIIVIPELRQRFDEAVISQSEQKEGPVELVQKAYFFFLKFQGLVVDMILSFKDRLESQRYFQNKGAEEALKIIEIELNFMYEVFYTKVSVVRQYWFWFCGKFVSLISITATLLLFMKAERDADFDKLDVRVTYVLLSGALILDVMALVMRFFSDYTATISDESLMDSYSSSLYQKFKTKLFKFLNKRFLACFLKLREPTWTKIDKGTYAGFEKLCTKFLFRRWCGSISGHNLLKYSLSESSVPRVPMKLQSFYICSHFKDLIDQWWYKDKNPFLKELWQDIYKKLKDKSDKAHDIDAIQSICSARGELAIRNLESSEQSDSLKPFVDPNEVVFDESLILWHIATTLCYHKDATEEGAEREISSLSMILSDYMLYLLIMQPNMMSAIAGIGQKRFQDTCEEAKMFFKKRVSDRKATLKEAGEILMKVPTEQKPIDVKGDRSKSLLFDACRLAKELEKLGGKEKWEIISCVWVELLSYAACHIRPTGHVQLLSKGGELISFVWLLMVQLGLGTQFQIKEGDARAKLIVGK